MKWLIGLGAVFAVVAALALGSTASAQEVNVTIDDITQSGITGSATLTASADGTETEVVVTGNGLISGTPGPAHINHIHSGDCSDIGPIVVTLTELMDEDDDGSDTRTTTVTQADDTTPFTLADIADGNHVIVIHDNDLLLATCGPIPVPTAAATATATEAADAETATPEATSAAGTATPALPTTGFGGGASEDGGFSSWMIAALAGAGILAAGAFVAARLRAVRQ